MQKGANYDEETCQYFLMQAVDSEEKHRCVLKNYSSELDEGIKKLCEEFSDVFEEPKGLPPLREGHNHPVVLLEGANPVNLRPYRYPKIQKDEIERQVRELLEAGVIRNSSSSFASPIVLVNEKDGT